MFEADEGWSGPYDQTVTMGDMYALGDMGGFSYTPNMNDPGKGSAYYPGSVQEDNNAMSYLGIAVIGVPGGGNGQARDMAERAGAFNPEFQLSVREFQAAVSPAAGPIDGWIGLQTRLALAQAVSVKNAQDNPISPPFVQPVVVVPPNITPNVIPQPLPSPVPQYVPPPQGGVLPTPGLVQPAAAAKKDNTMLYVGLAIAAVVVGAGVYVMAD